MLPATVSAQQWKTIELPVNKTVQANVLEIISPNLFYALPNGMPGKKPKFEIYAHLLNCKMEVPVLNSLGNEGEKRLTVLRKN